MWVGYRGKMSRKILGSEDAARFGPLVSNEGEKVVHSAEGPLCCPILWFLSRLMIQNSQSQKKINESNEQ
jgi:hypothetical protein